MNTEKDFIKVATIDGKNIYKDKDGYFMREHYTTPGGAWYSLPVRLGATEREARQTITEQLDLNYRYWHGEREAVLTIIEQLDMVFASK